jgi:hypothetical protein
MISPGPEIMAPDTGDKDPLIITSRVALSNHETSFQIASATARNIFKSHIGTVSQLQCTTEHYCTCYQNEGYASYHSRQEDLGQTILPYGQRAAFSKSLSADYSTQAKDGRPAVQIQQGLAAKPSFLQIQSKTANGRCRGTHQHVLQLCS